MRLQERHLYGAGAAACAACCAAPVLGLLGVAGTAATVAAFVLAGAVFGLVVAVGAVLALWARRRQRQADAACAPTDGPVDLELGRDRFDLPS